MKQLIPLILILLLTTSHVSSQPDRELRAVWLTSVYNIDWPHSNSVSAINQKNRLVNILNTLQEGNINAVLFQVRPSADALYKSAYEPWSHWITGTRGNDPGYDPLAFLIEEANKRGIEVHAWLNPYRFEITAGQFSGQPGDYSQTHPELIFTHNGRTYFDPGIPATTQLIKEIVADLVSNYDLDGVVFDDYFYPSGMPLSADQQTYDTYATEEFVGQWYPTLNRGNFRRASVNNMVREVNDTIKAINPSLVFGMSPAGIYSTSAAAAANWGTTLPAGISGNDNYNVIYCDPLAWLHDGAIDYISPQLYWVIGGPQDFVTLTEWWGYQASRYDRHSYPSLGSYRLYSNKDMPLENIPEALKGITPDLFKLKDDGLKSNWPVTEIADQIIANRENPHNLAQGLIFYNTSSYISPTKDLVGYLAQDLFSEKTIFPFIPWMPEDQPGAPQIAEMGAVGGMSDDVVAMNIINSPASRFLLYGWEDDPAKGTHSDAEFLQVVFGNDFSLLYHQDKNYFAVEEFFGNRGLGNLSDATTFTFMSPATLISPLNETICDGSLFSWEEMAEGDGYQVLISRAQNPGSVIYTSPVVTGNSYILPESFLEGQRDYVYRVKTIAEDAVSWSALGTFFTGQPETTVVNAPANGAENVSLTTTVQWNTVPGAEGYHLQIASHHSFDPEYLVVDQQPVSMNFVSVNLLLGNHTHYVRTRVINSCGYSVWSDVNAFTTQQGTFAGQPRHIVLEAFPNPANTYSRISYPKNPGERTIALFDSNGRLLAKEIRNNETRYDKIDLSYLVPGFYYVRIQTAGGEQFVSKVIRNR